MISIYSSKIIFFLNVYFLLIKLNELDEQLLYSPLKRPKQHYSKQNVTWFTNFIVSLERN